jgi:hypothetical protein
VASDRRALDQFLVPITSGLDREGDELSGELSADRDAKVSRRLEELESARRQAAQASRNYYVR